MDVQGCRLPALKTPQTLPAAPRRHSGRGRPFLQLQQVPEAVAASFYGRSRLPFASPQNSPNPSLQLPGATQAAADLSCSSNKSLRPWQCPFKEVQGCRLPAFKTLKPSPAAPRRHSGRGRPFLQLQQVPEAVAASFYGRSRLPFASPQNSPNPSLQLPGATQAAADLSCSSNKSLTPWQRLFMDVQGCRLSALKTPQTLPCSSQAPLRPRQTFPAAPTSPWGRGSVLLRRFKAAVCQPSKLPKPSPAAPRRHSGFLRPWQCPFTEVPGCRLPALKTPQTHSAAPRRHSGRGRPFLQL